MLTNIHANELIRGSHPGTEYGGIWMYLGISGDRLAQKYPQISGSNMVIAIFTMTVWPKQSDLQVRTGRIMDCTQFDQYQ